MQIYVIVKQIVAIVQWFVGFMFIVTFSTQIIFTISQSYAILASKNFYSQVFSHLISQNSEKPSDSVIPFRSLQREFPVLKLRLFKSNFNMGVAIEMNICFQIKSAPIMKSWATWVGNTTSEPWGQICATSLPPISVGSKALKMWQVILTGWVPVPTGLYSWQLYSG